MAWKPGMMLGGAVLLAALAILWLRPGASRQPASAGPDYVQPAPAAVPGAPAALPPISAPAAPPPPATTGCAPAPEFAAAAEANAATLQSLAWTPFGKPETGWETYAPLIEREVGSSCGPTEAGFAAALARWQADHKLPADGLVSAANFELMRVTWHRRRPFVAEAARACPPGADAASLATAAPEESYGGKQISLRTDALAAYREMIAAARGEQPAIFSSGDTLRIFSGYRSPLIDGARCLTGVNCDGRAQSNCSAHRTALAVDLYLGAAPGFKPESSEDANRLFLSRTPAYRWLVSNAARFGFAPYAYEPWHWEWTGRSGATATPS